MHWPEMVIGGNWSHTTPEVCHIQSSLTCFHLIQKLKTLKKKPCDKGQGHYLA